MTSTPSSALSLPLVISDRSRPANSGRWQLSVSDGKGILVPNGPVVPPAREALTVGARGLSALYAGTPVSTLRLAGASLDAAFAATPVMVDEF